MLSVLAVTAMLASPSPTSTVAGVVRDADTRLPLVGAAVSVGGARGDVITDSVGRFQVTQVPAGVRRMTVRCLGHSALTLDIVVPGEGLLHIDVLLASSPTRLANVDVYPARVLREPFSRDRRTRAVSDQPFQPHAVAGCNTHVRVQTESLHRCTTRTGNRLHAVPINPVTEQAHTFAGIWSGCNAAPNR